MKHNPPMAFLFGFIAATGITLTIIGVKQKRTGDAMIGVLMALGALLIFLFNFF